MAVKSFSHYITLKWSLLSPSFTYKILWDSIGPSWCVSQLFITLTQINFQQERLVLIYSFRGFSHELVGPIALVCGKVGQYSLAEGKLLTPRPQEEETVRNSQKERG